MCPKKCIWRLLAKNLNDFNLQLIGQTVYYSVNLSLNVSFDPMRGEEPPKLHVVPHVRYISDIS